MFHLGSAQTRICLAFALTAFVCLPPGHAAELLISRVSTRNNSRRGAGCNRSSAGRPQTTHLLSYAGDSLLHKLVREAGRGRWP